MKYEIINVITGEKVDILDLVKDLSERDKLFRLPSLFRDEFTDLKIMPINRA